MGSQEEFWRGDGVADFLLHRNPRNDTRPSTRFRLLLQPRLKGLLRVSEVTSRVEDVRGPARVDRHVEEILGSVRRREIEAVAKERERGEPADGSAAQAREGLPRERVEMLVQDQERMFTMVATQLWRRLGAVQFLERFPEVHDNLAGIICVSPRTSRPCRLRDSPGRHRSRHRPGERR